MIPHVIRPEIIDPNDRAENGVTGRDLNGGIVSPPANSVPNYPSFSDADREAVLFNLRGEAPLPHPFALSIAERYEATVIGLEHKLFVQQAALDDRGDTIDQLILEGKKLGDEVQRLRKLVAEKTLEATALSVALSMASGASTEYIPPRIDGLDLTEDEPPEDPPRSEAEPSGEYRES